MTSFSAEAPPPPVRAVGSVLAGCRIEAVLHVGPVCTVYQAGDAVGAGRWALKEYCPAALCVRDDDGTPRLRDPADVAARNAFEAGRTACLEELRLLSRLRLPGLVTVLQASEAQGSLCGVMPLLPGLTLDRLAPARSDDDVRELLLALLEPLAQLHAAGLVHGGLHARQLLWTLGQRPVLLGFQSAARALRLPEAFLDAAPELRPEGAHLPRGPWTDLYALACTVLRHTTSGAWDGSSAAADVAVALAQALPTPGGPLRAALVQALQACLRPSPTERPAGAVALRALLGDTPASAPTASHPAPRRSEARPAPVSGHEGVRRAGREPGEPEVPVPAQASPRASTAMGASTAVPEPQAARVPAPGKGTAASGAGLASDFDPALAMRPGNPDELDPLADRSRVDVPEGAGEPALNGMPSMFTDAPASSRRHVALRAAVLGLPLLAGLGYAAWWAQGQWQAQQERDHVARLMAQAASQVQAPAPTTQVPPPPMDVLPDPRTPRVALPAPPAPGGLVGAVPPAARPVPSVPPVALDSPPSGEAPPSVTGLGAAPPVAETPPAPVPAPAPARPRDEAVAAAPPATPLAACVAQPKSALSRCMQRQCARPAWRGHVQCERWLQQEREGRP